MSSLVATMLVALLGGGTGVLAPAAATSPTPDVALHAMPRQPAPSHGTWPLIPAHQVVRGFDPPADPWGPGHRGVDLLGQPGEPVHAALAGTITFAGQLAGRGVVVVDHGAERTTYEPVAASVGVGDPVAEGAVIGTLQLVGSHCFPRACLHWGLLRGDSYLDPLTLVGAGPVRLLPMETGRAGPS
ncbi:murein hydrolase activator EnvC family protein [Nocardioides terrisoli]|uniref:murein hydrolase activator EnvC family protein n=1 Tax=Nocardioides terrisoli TaxID=3388267 RepID=UPI00287BAC7E|nr:M23 family metallopeptidase [Nocardioides marmorisolisilvae]